MLGDINCASNGPLASNLSGCGGGKRRVRIKKAQFKFPELSACNCFGAFKQRE